MYNGVYGTIKRSGRAKSLQDYIQQRKFEEFSSTTVEAFLNSKAHGNEARATWIARHFKEDPDQLSRLCNFFGALVITSVVLLVIAAASGVFLLGLGFSVSDPQIKTKLLYVVLALFSLGFLCVVSNMLEDFFKQAYSESKILTWEIVSMEPDAGPYVPLVIRILYAQAKKELGMGLIGRIYRIGPYGFLELEYTTCYASGEPYATQKAIVSGWIADINDRAPMTKLYEFQGLIYADCLTEVARPA